MTDRTRNLTDSLHLYTKHLQGKGITRRAIALMIAATKDLYGRRGVKKLIVPKGGTSA